MSDTQQKRPDPHPAPPQEDEEIIDLLDEVPEGSIQRPFSSLEWQLLDLEHPTPPPENNAVDLLDVNDLVGAEDLPPLSEPDPTAAPVSGEIAGRPAAQGNGIERVPELDKQAFDSRDLRDIERLLSATGLEERESDWEEDEFIELIDAEEEESDDKIIWFDDLNKGTGWPETSSEAGPPEAPILDADTAPGQETTVADVFSANVRALPVDAPTAPEIGTAEAADGAAAAAADSIHPLSPSAEHALPPAEPGTPSPAPATLSDAEIEAAVERVIERKLGRTIESIIHQAIENAVSKEIERLKSLLLDNDHGAAP